MEFIKIIGQKIETQLSIVSFKDDHNIFNVLVPALDITTYADSIADAKTAASEAKAFHLKDWMKKNVLHEVLLQQSWVSNEPKKIRYAGPSWYPLPANQYGNRAIKLTSTRANMSVPI
jgi:predicted RNase H-like HicB family nuclease